MGTGNTAAPLRKAKTLAVHPRGHGEHLSPWVHRFMHHGSSPWARGTLLAAVDKITRPRFIPVGTGNTNANPNGAN